MTKEEAIVQLRLGPGDIDVSEEYNEAVDIAIKELEKGLKYKQEKLLPCTCGSNRRYLWMNTNPGEPNWFYVCDGCDRKVYGKNKTDLRRQWNETIRKEVEG